MFRNAADVSIQGLPPPDGTSRRGRFYPLAVLVFASAALLESVLFTGRSAIAADVSPQDAQAETQKLVDQALHILRNSNLSLTEERNQLRDMAEAHFDFAGMARSALGYHWKELSEDQRRQFVQLFTAFIEDAYLTRIQQYSGQDIQFVDEKSDDPGYITVDTRVLGKGDSPIALDFRCKREGNDWKIYDVTVDAISITANYRNQFSRVINNQGFDKLMSDLRAKQSELASLLGKRS